MLMPENCHSSVKAEGCTRSKPGFDLAPPPRFLRDVKRPPLGVALDTWFHSLIEVILRHEERQQRRPRVPDGVRL
jgi:hypothetical protein